jgi:hypothetical protein
VTHTRSKQPNEDKATKQIDNQMTVRMHDISSDGDFNLFAEISPPNIKHISLVRFSPSGRLLLVGNESG